MDKRLQVDFPDIEFDSSLIIKEAELRIEKKRKHEQLIFIVIIAFLGIVMLLSLICFQQFFIVFQICIMVIVSPIILLFNFLRRESGKGHSHGY
jgi:type IV secretory pathway TrbL component